MQTETYGDRQTEISIGTHLFGYFEATLSLHVSASRRPRPRERIPQSMHR